MVNRTALSGKSLYPLDSLLAFLVELRAVLAERLPARAAYSIMRRYLASRPAPIVVVVHAFLGGVKGRYLGHRFL